MTVDEILKAHRTRPFRPFTIHLADGRTYTIRHPEFLAISPTRRTVAVYLPDGLEIIDLFLVSSIWVPEESSGTGPARPQ